MHRSSIAAIATLLAAGPAHAGTLTVEQREGFPEDPAGSIWYAATYVAAVGEANTVTFDRSEDTWTLTDAGAAGPIAAPAPCTSVSPTTVTCPRFPPGAERLMFTRIALGDGDDGFDIAYATETTDPVRVVAGPGNDTLTGVRSLEPIDFRGGDGDDRLTGSDAGGRISGDLLVGGPGDDTIAGGGGSDTILGDDRTASHVNGSDRLDGGADGDFLTGDGPATPAPDVLIGGPGSDWAEFATARMSVRVDLTGGVPGGAAAGDKLTGIDGLVGGRGDDVLAGHAGANYLAGSYGDDLLVGRGGDDELSGWKGRDRLRGGRGADEIAGDHGADRQDGGPGDDVLDAAEDTARGDALSCGDGRDVVRNPNAAQRIPAACEGVGLGAFGLVVDREIQAAAGGVTVRVVAGPSSAEEPLTLSAELGGGTIARAAVDVAAGATPRFVLRPTAGGAGALRFPLRALRLEASTLLSEASWTAPVR